MNNDGKMDAWVFNVTFTAKTCTVKAGDVEVSDDGAAEDVIEPTDVIEADSAESDSI
jgi:hypothetical protein